MKARSAIAEVNRCVGAFSIDFDTELIDAHYSITHEGDIPKDSYYTAEEIIDDYRIAVLKLLDFIKQEIK